MSINRKLTKDECLVRASIYENCADYLAGRMDLICPPSRAAAQRIEENLRVRAAKWRVTGRKRA